MIIFILLPCVTLMVSAVPVRPDVLSQGEATEATNPDAQTPAPLSPTREQTRPDVPQQPDLQSGPRFPPPIQHYTWYPLGGSPMTLPLQQSVHRSQPANQPTLPQQPLIFPPYPYYPLLTSPYGNQLFSPYGFPMILASPPVYRPQNSQVLPAETPAGAAPSGNSPQPIQQQQNPQIVLMFQKPINSALGSLSSEELEMAAKMSQMGVYLSTVLTNPFAGASQPVSQGAGLTNPTDGDVQPVNEAAGLKNQEEQGVVPTLGTLSAAVPRTPGPASSGPQPNTNRVPAGLQGPTQETATIQTSVKPKLQPTQGNLV